MQIAIMWRNVAYVNFCVVLKYWCVSAHCGMSAVAFVLLSVGCHSYGIAACVTTADAKKCVSVLGYSHTGCCNSKESHIGKQSDAFVYTNTLRYQTKKKILLV